MKCIIPNCIGSAPSGEPFCKKHRDKRDAAIASAPAGDRPSMYPKDHLENIEKAIDYCDRRLADRFGNFIRATLQQCKHDPSCGTFDNYDCDCSVADTAALDRPRAAVGEREAAREILRLAKVFGNGCGHTQNMSGHGELTDAGRLSGVDIRTGDPADCEECSVDFVRRVVAALQSPPAKVEE